jgi:hypothetical protein
LLFSLLSIIVWLVNKSFCSMLLSTTSRAAKLAVRQAPALAPLTRTFADAAHAPPIALFGLEAKVSTQQKAKCPFPENQQLHTHNRGCLFVICKFFDMPLVSI